MIEINSEDEIRAKVMNTLAEALPYKQSLSLRLLITYCVDGGAMQSCVIDEILSRNNKTNNNTNVNNNNTINNSVKMTQNEIPHPISVRPVDLSTPKSTSPPTQITEPYDKPLINNITDNTKTDPLPMMWDQMKNFLNTPLNSNLINKDNLLTNNPFLPLLNSTKPVLDNDIIQSLIDKLNNGRKNQPLINENFMNANLKHDFPMMFSQEKVKKYARKEGPINGVKGEKKMRYNRNFNCNQCKANFNSLADLNRHTVETHSTFKCTICSASFTQRSNLQRHSLKHVGFKPFTCALCKKEYYRKDHLMRHIEVTHPHVDPKSSIITHLTSSECLEYLEKMNLSHNITNGPFVSEKKTISENNVLNKLDAIHTNMNLNNSQILLNVNDMKENIQKPNDSNNNYNELQINKDASPNIATIPTSLIKTTQKESNEEITAKVPEDIQECVNETSCAEDEDHDDLYETDDCNQVNIEHSFESHLMQQTLDKSFKEADVHRPEEPVTYINESIYDSGEVYGETTDNDDLDDEDDNYEVDHGESEAAVATLQMSDDSHQGSGLMEVDEQQNQLNVK